MAKATVVGDAVVITSSVKLADYKKVKKYRPKALRLMGGEDNKEEIFGVGITDGEGEVKKFCIEFGRETHDEEKLACLTVKLPNVGERNIKEVVADTFGPALEMLAAIEEKIPDVLAEIEASQAKILSSITVL